ncbi:MAG: hypothetical protein JWQ96_3124 [Segetibacter sp.]|nr:hypothetical protein [Segetibacter sp.]
MPVERNLPNVKYNIKAIMLKTAADIISKGVSGWIISLVETVLKEMQVQVSDTTMLNNKPNAGNLNFFSKICVRRVKVGYPTIK